MHFTGIKFCVSLHLMIFMMVCSQYLIFYKYYILPFCANPQKQTLVPANNSHLKVYHIVFTI